ncbi:MAG: DJ-1 family glyoxalase III [Kiritimatiellia bacterium]
MPKTLVLVANGSEEMEAVITIDVLRRAGWPVTVAAVQQDTTITASRGVQIVADAALASIDTTSYDLLVLPGGKGGADTFTEDPNVQQAIKAFDADNKTIAAICAAPLALDAAGILRNRRYTCYPGVEENIHAGTYTTATVVIDQNLVTSPGPGTSFAFALALVERLENKKAADTLRRQMLLDV